MSESLPPGTRVGAVSLTITNLERSLQFYQERLGFTVHRRAGEAAYLGAGGPDLVVLAQDPGARRVGGTTGLYHFAVLLPSRAALALALGRLAETRTRLQGLSDHGVSEAIYLADPDGNGIEISSDRPRGEWPFDGGRLRMMTEPLDVEGLMSEPAGRSQGWAGLPPGTMIGHIHLHVPDLGSAEAFYAGVLGFDIMQRLGPSALFLSAGGYHHHVGLNTWAGVGASPPPPGSIGLRHFVVRLPKAAELARVAARVRGAGVAMEETPAGLLVRDPSGNSVVLSGNDSPD